jgi:hypothetical protein
LQDRPGGLKLGRRALTALSRSGGASPGAPKGKANGACRHGRFTNEAIERRRELNALIRLMQKTAGEVE